MNWSLGQPPALCLADQVMVHGRTSVASPKWRYMGLPACSRNTHQTAWQQNPTMPLHSIPGGTGSAWGCIFYNHDLVTSCILILELRPWVSPASDRDGAGLYSVSRWARGFPTARVWSPAALSCRLCAKPFSITWLLTHCDIGSSIFPNGFT